MSKASKKPVQITDMRRLRLQDGDILVVKENVVDPNDRGEFIETIERTVGKKIVLVFANSLSSLKRLEVAQILRGIGSAKLWRAGYIHRSEIISLSEFEIREAGWVRPEEVLREDD